MLWERKSTCASWTVQISSYRIAYRPFFDNVEINFPNAEKPLKISSKGAPNKPYVKSLKVNGKSLKTPIIKHDQIALGGNIEFEMSGKPEAWASSTLVG